MNPDLLEENPYLAVVNRKARNLRKKLASIAKAEAQLLTGKALNEEQLVLLASKPSVERAISDIDIIRVQLEDVAKDLVKIKIVETPQEEVVIVEVPPAPEIVEQIVISTEPEVVVVEQRQPLFDEQYINSLVLAQVHKLIKTLHVCSRYQSITGTSLPADVDYFGKCLLGMTSIGDFQDALQQSVRNATLFLDPVLGSQHEAIRGMNFVELAELIDQLASHVDTGSNNSMESFLNALASPPSNVPEINFFAAGPEESQEVSQFASTNNSDEWPEAPASAQDVVVDSSEGRKKRNPKPRKDKKERVETEKTATSTNDATAEPSKVSAEKPKKFNNKKGNQNAIDGVASSTNQDDAPKFVLQRVKANQRMLPSQKASLNSQLLP